MSKKLFLVCIAVLMVFEMGFMGFQKPTPISAQSGDEFYSAADFNADVALYLSDIQTNDSSATLALVDLMLGENEAASNIAAMELLRRAGVPLVSPDGSVVALPDDRVLEDAAVYADFIPQMVQATRRGDFYTPEQLVELIHGFELSLAVMPAHAVIAGLGAWGKNETSPLESQVAGTTVRALSAHRQQVLYTGVDLTTVKIDPFQTLLILAHLTTSLRIDATAYHSPSATNQYLMLQSDPCTSLKEQLEGRGLVPEGSSDAPINQGDQHGVIEGLRGELIGVITEKALGEEMGGTVANTIDRGTKGLNLLILLMGAQLDLSADKTVTHFKHGGGDNENVHLTATARFDSALAQKKLTCYELAGLSIPPNGTLEGFKVRWNLSQPKAARVQQGAALLVTVSSDSNKIESCGTCGETTGSNGQSTLELMPATEQNPEVGEEMSGMATVTASLDKADFPFKLSDLMGLKNPAGFAITKIYDLVINAVTRAGLPTQSLSIEVGYHGYEIYTAQGEGTVWLFYVTMPVTLDIYSCTGLEGPWHGTAGMLEWDVTIMGDLASMISKQPLPGDFQALNSDVNFTIPAGAGEGIYPFFINGWMNGELELNGRAGRSDTYTLDRPVYVGDTDITVGDTSLESLCGMLGNCTVKYPIFAVSYDERCGEANTYTFEN